MYALLKACLNVLVRPITDIITASLCSGFFPDDLRHAHVNPVLKKTHLSKEDLNSNANRPISDLSFIFEVIKKVVVNRLRSCIYTNFLSSVSQSVYKKLHSTKNNCSF